MLYACQGCDGWCVECYTRVCELMCGGVSDICAHC